MKSLTAAILLALTLLGCAKAPPDFAAPLDPMVGIRGYLMGHMKDPLGVQIAGINGPYMIRGAGFRPSGYLYCLTMNARNSYGGYVGFQTYKFIFYTEDQPTLLDDWAIWAECN
jgi:hypothetical protein